MLPSAHTARALLTQRFHRFDVYAGSGDQLVAAGLLREDQLPGRPGRPPIRCTYFRSDGVPATPMGVSFEPTFWTQRFGADRYTVAVGCFDAEIARRRRLRPDFGPLPLELPGTLIDGPGPIPEWQPIGWRLVACRAGETGRPDAESDEEFVFVVDDQILRDGDLVTPQAWSSLEAQPLPWSVRLLSLRFGTVSLTRRGPNQHFVAVRAPSDVRNAAYRREDLGHAVLHVGTKEQLLAQELGAGVVFPGEPGADPSRVKARDAATGADLRIELLARPRWCGSIPRYALHVYRNREQLADYRLERRRREHARNRLERLRSLPPTPAALREHLVAGLRQALASLRLQMQSPDGYRYASDTINEVLRLGLLALRELEDGLVTGESPRNTLQRLLAEQAREDQGLQRFLGSLGQA